jgi:hypothetical protein
MMRDAIPLEADGHLEAEQSETGPDPEVDTLSRNRVAIASGMLDCGFQFQ